MNLPIEKYSEQQIEVHAKELFQSINVCMVGAIKVRVGREGRFEIDALGVDKSGIVVAEFKSVRDKGVVGQLLTYCHIVRETAQFAGINLPVRGLIASTHVDENWLAVTQQLRDAGVIDISVMAVMKDAASGRMYLNRVPNENDGWVRNAAGPVAERAALIARLREALATRTAA